MSHGSDDSEVIKQVEVNTMSAAASGVNRAATNWHRSECKTPSMSYNNHSVLAYKYGVL